MAWEREVDYMAIHRDKQGVVVCAAVNIGVHIGGNLFTSCITISFSNGHCFLQLICLNRHHMLPSPNTRFFISTNFIVPHHFNNYIKRFGGVVVSVLAIGPKVRGFKPCRGDVFLRATKIRSRTSFGGEVKSVDLCKILRLRHVKNNL
jgi:hypothetical protein